MQNLLFYKDFISLGFCAENGSTLSNSISLQILSKYLQSLVKTAWKIQSPHKSSNVQNRSSIVQRCILGLDVIAGNKASDRIYFL